MLNNKWISMSMKTRRLRGPLTRFHGFSRDSFKGTRIKVTVRSRTCNKVYVRKTATTSRRLSPSQRHVILSAQHHSLIDATVCTLACVRVGKADQTRPVKASSRRPIVSYGTAAIRQVEISFFADSANLYLSLPCRLLVLCDGYPRFLRSDRRSETSPRPNRNNDFT